MGRFARRISGMTAFGLLGLAAGCTPTLFPPDADRSVYDRHDRLRNQYEPMFVFDEFGRRRPNLRGRLSQAR